MNKAEPTNEAAGLAGPDEQVMPVGAAGKSEAAAAATFPGVDAAAKPSVADAVLQLASGGPQKNVAPNHVIAAKSPAEKTNVETTGVSVDDPMMFGLPGTGNAVPHKIEAISADDSLTDDSGQPVALQNPVAEPAPFAPTKSHGTSVAKQDVPMNKAEQTNEVAGLAGPGGQVLPGDAVPAVSANVFPVRGNFIPVSARVEPWAANAAAAPASPDHTFRSASLVEDAAVVSNVSDLRSQALERTHDLIMQQALRLVDAKSDSLHVVLMPEAGTKLSLELRQRGNGIEARAVLQSGDFDNLKQHWPELQQRLELRGIKLAPLTSDANSAMGSGQQGFKNQPEPSAERGSFPAGALAGFVPAGAKNNLPAEPAIPAASSRGWHTWA